MKKYFTIREAGKIIFNNFSVDSFKPYLFGHYYLNGKNGMPFKYYVNRGYFLDRNPKTKRKYPYVTQKGIEYIDEQLNYRYAWWRFSNRDKYLYWERKENVIKEIKEKNGLVLFNADKYLLKDVELVIFGIERGGALIYPRLWKEVQENPLVLDAIKKYSDFTDEEIKDFQSIKK